VTPIDELKFEVNLRAGESLVIAPTKDVMEMGKILFGSYQTTAHLSDLDKEISGKPVPTHRMLLIRVVQTQMDDLFSDSNLNEKLTTIQARRAIGNCIRIQKRFLALPGGTNTTTASLH